LFEDASLEVALTVRFEAWLEQNLTVTQNMLSLRVGEIAGSRI
jgi:hypothetical protein